MTNFVFDLINQFSYIAIENVFPPIPSEVILSFARFATRHSQMTVVGTVIASTIGGSPWSFNFIRIGWFLNEERLERILDHKAFKMLGFKRGDVQKAFNWFDKYGTGAIFLWALHPCRTKLNFNSCWNCKSKNI